METNVHNLLPTIVDLLLDTIFAIDADGRVVYVSAGCERTFGYSQRELTGRELFDLVVLEDRERTIAEAARVMSGKPRIGFENRYARKDGRQVHIMWSACWSEQDGLRIGVARDVTERRRAEKRQAALHAISEVANNAADLDEAYREIHRVIAQFAPVSGFAIATHDSRSGQLELLYRIDAEGNPLEIPGPIMLQHCAAAMHTAQATLFPEEERSEAMSWLVLPLINRKSPIGAVIIRSLHGSPFSDDDGELLQFVSAQIASAIERWRLHAELLRSARYDDLTGLPNRRLLHDRIKSALARCRRRQSRAAVMFVDIDRFKGVNDSLGHAVGDALLKSIAQRLQQCVREEDTVARLAGDEFVVLIEDVEACEDAQVVADKIRRSMLEAVELDGHLLRTGASVGIAFYPEHGQDAEQLLKHADEAMYREKKLRRLAL